VPAIAAFVLIAAAILLSRENSTAAPLIAAIADSRTTLEQIPLLETVLSGLPQPVIALDVQGEVLAANAPARAVAPALRRGEPVSLALRVPEVLEAIRRAISSDVPQRVEFIERVPLERWHEAIVVPVALLGAAPQPASRLVLVTLDDLTPLRRMEEMRADFVANASHELRTPLAALSGFIETLQGQARDDPAARTKFLSIMQAQATRMARLIDDLLSLSRIELNAHLRPNTRVELRGIVRQVVDGLQTLARDREVEIGVTASADQVEVLGDRDELLRVFENLIENALKYAASGKRVEVTLSADSVRNEARVAVRDFGPGIAPEHLPRLTERFYRVDVADSRAQGGTGLGLALVKHILNRHGGRLTIESVTGQGATFTAVLPLAAGRSK
jgi:two-component system, OmpR family, phosphate regulon sensor histidine kinase PhoR